MKEVQELEERLSVLLKQFAALRTENKRLKRTVTEKDNEISKLQQQLEEAQQGLLANDIAKALPTLKEKQKTRKQLDAVIGEIDKILTSLND